MNTPLIRSLNHRLSLRPPQLTSLKMLADVCDRLDIPNHLSSDEALARLKEPYPHVTAFDRDFPSLCFALATGVGKTRLMGAFIAYLYQTYGLRNFFVIAPNLTIYQKLITDFTPQTSKYVFTGVGPMDQPEPRIITGDNYESGLGVRHSLLPGVDRDLHINIFNISKITARQEKSKLAKDDERRNLARIRRLSEYIGQSYFDYLAGLPDLVVLMDESHRYRADAGMAAINELSPLLGLEFTATPQTENNGHPEPFNNTIYTYSLAQAITDGFVKEPAVVTRKDFIAKDFSPDQLETIKLEDGVHTHEDTRTTLEIFCRNNGVTIVKPFMLVVATDTTHANALQTLMESDSFFEGRYKGKVLTVHSKKTKGGEGDETVRQLLTVESPDNPVEIVIHVNMLKEGWDVTNLYTIVPLRAANSRTLVEQSIGRGLRLPFGRRTGAPAVDRLSIISHDKFQEIIDHANDPNSIIRTGLVIGRDISTKREVVVVAPSALESLLLAKVDQTTTPTTPASPAQQATPSQPETPLVLQSEEAKAVARQTCAIIQRYVGLKSSADLQTPQMQEKLVREITATLPPRIGSLLPGKEVSISAVVEATTRLYQQLTIDIPRIIVVPQGEVKSIYDDFDLDCTGVHKNPVAQDILVQHLQSHTQYTIAGGTGIVREQRPENYLVRQLMDCSDICYDEHNDLLYKLAGQMVQHLRTYLKNEEEVDNVLQYHQQSLADFIHAQMLPHFHQTATSYEAQVSRGFIPLRAANYTARPDQPIEDLHTQIPEGERQSIKTRLFGGFKKSLYPVQKFDSYPELLFARVLEQDATVTKWLRPPRGAFPIHRAGNKSYEPDFVVETLTEKVLCEPKMRRELNSPEVQDKTNAARTWCEQATKHSNSFKGKPWRYLLLPHDLIGEQMTLDGLTKRVT